MNKPIGFEDMTPVRKALEVARHRLVTLNGLQAFDKEAPREPFEIEAGEAIGLIDEAMKSLGECWLGESDRRQLFNTTKEFIERVEKGGGCEVDGQIFPAAVDLLKFLVEGHS